jgi:L-ascorbate metabolism protein UlaG (beta-lactamase superfamily)
MYIKKLGHCCLLVKTNGVTILTDPGAWSTLQNEVTGVDIVLITHEHQDHYHIDSLNAVLKNNPGAVIITNNAVSLLLEEQGIPFTIITDGMTEKIKNVSFTGVGDIHALIHESMPRVENTGYVIDDYLYCPGDAFALPKQSITVLALPVCGPWMHMSEALDFAEKINPKVCFPIHDGMLKIIGPFHRVPQMVLEPKGIQFVPMIEGDEKEF